MVNEKIGRVYSNQETQQRLDAKLFKRNNIKNIMYLLLFMYIAYFQVTISQSLCPTKCQCYLSHEPRRIICSNQKINNYPITISDLVQHLDLSDNVIEDLPDELDNLIDLQHLNLAHNRLKSLPKNLRHLGKLQKLDLSDNNIANTSDISSIVHLTNLKVLLLSKNQLTQLDGLTNFALQALDASQCSISHMSSTSLSGLPELVTLKLEGNPLKSIQRLTSEKLRWLDLSDCCLNYLSPDTFEGVPDLEQLRLSNNPTLVYSSRSETLRHGNLKKLDVTGCNLDRPGLFGFPSLTHVILSRNHITALPDRIFAKNRMLVQLRLDGNGLSIVNKSSFAGLTKLETLDLSSNNLARLHPFVFHETVNLRLLNLSFNDFLHFPNIMSTTLTLDLSSNFIQNVPIDFSNNLPRLSTLDLSDNRLEGVCSQFVSETLMNLLLKRNRLLQLANNSFSKLPELQMIDLSGNRLTEGMTFEIFASNENLLTVVLGDNPWRCDCQQLRPTFLYLMELPVKMNSENLICQSPSNVSGFSWEAACRQEWNAELDLSKDKTWGLFMLIFLVIIVLFGTTVSLRHTLAIKRQARLERLRLEREEGIERLRLLRRRNLELEAAVNEISTSEPRINPLELINPPPYEEAVQMPRMAQSLDALDSIPRNPEIIGSVESLRGRKRRQHRRTARNRARSEDNLLRGSERSQQSRRSRSGTSGRKKYSPSLMFIASRNVSQRTGERNTVSRNSAAIVRETESEEHSSDVNKRRARPQTPISKKKRRGKPSKNGNSTDDEDSDMLEPRVIINRTPDIHSNIKPLVIHQLQREPRSCYRPTA